MSKYNGSQYHACYEKQKNWAEWIEEEQEEQEESHFVPFVSLWTYKSSQKARMWMRVLLCKQQQ